MFVKDYMSVDPITVNPNDTVGEALELLKDHAVRRLPVVNRGRLVGLVTEMDLMKASPSLATSLSIHEINYLYPQIKIRDIMTKDLTTVTPDAAIEEAAVTMREKKFGTLVVVEKDKLVGLITESDLFKAFIDVFGFDRPGVRIIVEFEDEVGTLSKLSSLISSMNIYIISLIMTYPREGRVNGVMRLKTDDKDKVVEALKKEGYEVLG